MLIGRTVKARIMLLELGLCKLMCYGWQQDMHTLRGLHR